MVRYGRGFGQIIEIERIKVVSWDVDGTLYALSRAKRMFLNQFFRNVLHRSPGLCFRELLELHKLRKLVSEIRTRGGVIDSSELASNRSDLLAIEECWYGEAIRRAGLREGTRELIEKVHTLGLPQVIISDFYSSYKLTALGLFDVFNTVYAGENLGFIKPSPRIFTTVVQDLNIEPQNLLHIGDREDRDGVAARAAGCQVAIIGSGNNAFDDVLSILQL